MEIKQWSYEEFPDFAEPVEGALTLETSGLETGSLYTGVHLPYLTQGGVSLHLELLTPSRRTPWPGPFPCVVFVQGSAWMRQNVGIQLPLLGRLAERGFVVAAVEYRHSGVAAFPAQAVDTRNAIRYLRLHAQELQIDPARMLLAGDSSGGHTALFAALRHNDGTPENQYPGVSGEVRGVVDYYGSVSVLFEDANPSTPNHKLPDSPEGMVMGGANLREHPELCRALSVESQISPVTALAPVLILHGTKDRIVNTRQSVDFYRKLQACGKRSELVLLRGADHGGPEFWTPQILDLVETFAAECFGA